MELSTGYTHRRTCADGFWCHRTYDLVGNTDNKSFQLLRISRKVKYSVQWECITRIWHETSGHWKTPWVSGVKTETAGVEVDQKGVRGMLEVE